MRYIIILILTLNVGWSYTQVWQQIDADNYSFDGVFSVSPYINKHFKINHKNNSIWMTYAWGGTKTIREIDSNGVFSEFNYSTNAILNSQSTYEDIDFTESKTFVVSGNTGIYSYDGVDWSLEAGLTAGVHISTDKDSVWMARLNNDYFTWKDGVLATEPFSFKRIVSKNGKIWVSTGSWDIIASFEEGVGPTYFSPDTCNLLSWNNYDFKFARLSDSLYSSSDLGVSIAYGNMFVDSITPGNSVNMPGSGIIEFEFDSQDNIWAIFAPDFSLSTEATHIAYYDRSLNEWTKIFDSGNSPIDFTNRSSIEVDKYDNLWVINSGDLFVYKENQVPDWLDLEETEISKPILFPNPSNTTIKISGLQTGISIEVKDIAGKTIYSGLYEGSLDVADFKPGQYLLSIEEIETAPIKFTIVNQ